MKKALEVYLQKIFGPSTRLVEFKRLGTGVHGTGFFLEIEKDKEKNSM